MILVSEAMEGLSGAEIEQICKDAIREDIIQDKPLTFQTICKKILEHLSMRNEIPLQNKELFAKYFKALNPDFFSYASIGRILGVSKPTVCRYINKEE
ncbi:MAG: hypothetical protein RJR37_14105 [Peptococcaceae bacterium MAG4]|nr:hypothetical protein [Peptococcaceae bacterium MAG4]